MAGLYTVVYPGRFFHKGRPHAGIDMRAVERDRQWTPEETTPAGAHDGATGTQLHQPTGICVLTITDTRCFVAVARRRVAGVANGDLGGEGRLQCVAQRCRRGDWARGSCGDGRPPQGMRPSETARLHEVNTAGWSVLRADAEGQSSWGVWGRPRTPF